MLFIGKKNPLNRINLTKLLLIFFFFSLKLSIVTNAVAIEKKLKPSEMSTKERIYNQCTFLGVPMHIALKKNAGQWEQRRDIKKRSICKTYNKIPAGTVVDLTEPKTST